MENATTEKEMVWNTNYNGKMACDGFVHVDFKPGVMPSFESLEHIVFKISTKDGSHPSIKVKMVNIMAFELKRLTDQIAIPSHGITAMELASQLIDRNPNRINFETEFAIYFYKKINENDN
jgi:hypothetical protein